MRKQGMELWRPDWVKVYKTGNYECSVMPDIAGELIEVTRETLRIAKGALESQMALDYYDNYGTAYREIIDALKAKDESNAI